MCPAMPRVSVDLSTPFTIDVSISPESAVIPHAHVIIRRMP